MSCRVYVGHLPYSARERDVERFFRGFGRLREVNLKNGFCFVVCYRETVRMLLDIVILAGI